jgi:two-component system LytT family response regulator
LIGDKEILVSKNIKHFEDILEAQGFYRIHRSHLVNLNYIKEYYRGDGGYVTMTDGSSIPVSRRKKTAFLERIKAL